MLLVTKLKLKLKEKESCPYDSLCESDGDQRSWQHEGTREGDASIWMSSEFLAKHGAKFNKQRSVELTKKHKHEKNVHQGVYK